MLLHPDKIVSSGVRRMFSLQDVLSLRGIGCRQLRSLSPGGGILYRTIEDRIWDDPKVIRLPESGKLLFVYLIVNRHSHVSGIYRLPNSYITEDIGLSGKALDTLWNTLSEVGLAYRDAETQVVWVKNAMRFQGRGEKNELSAAKHIESLHKSYLVKQFLDSYPEVKKRVVDTLLDTLYDRGSEVRIKEQEKEQEQKKDKDSGGSQFERFWSAYPRKAGKPAAIKAFHKVEREADAVLAGLVRWCQCDQWKDPQYIPYPQKFLNQRRWEDAPVNGKSDSWKHVGASLPADETSSLESMREYHKRNNCQVPGCRVCGRKPSAVS